MPPPRHAGGFTAVELVVALLLLNLLLGLALPRLQALVDRSAVTGAREALVGMVGEARMRAVARGGAAVEIRTRPPSALLRAGDDSLRSLDLGARFGVGVLLSRDRDRVELRFDALGLGRVSSETVRLTRNGREARMVVSGYGRVRRP